MAITQAYVGSATIGTTEYSLPNASTTLTPIAVSGIYQLFLDFNALTATESYRLRINEKTQAGSTQRVVQDITISGVQSEPVYVTPSLLLMHGWDMTLQKLSGTDRAIEFSIRKVA
jgi:hypothetical protein